MKTPVRRDLATVNYLKYDTDKDNYIDINSQKLVLNHYKTVKFYGKKTISINRDAWKAFSWMRKQHRLRGLTDGHLLKNRYWKPMQANSFTSYLKTNCSDCFECCKGKRMGCSLLRHLVVSWKNRNAPTLLEKEDLAGVMMHSPEESDLYRINS